MRESRYNLFAMPSTDVEFSFQDAVRTLGVTPEKLQQLINDGKIPAAREGIHTTISRRAILDYLAEVSAVPAIERSKRR
jgi:excisionase family DNA binding protein